MTRTVGVDIGGANLKYATAAEEPGDARSYSRYFPMWRLADQLADAIADDLRGFGDIDALAVTMTGELADCFVDRKAGVDHIVTHAVAAATRVGIDDVLFYGVDGAFQFESEARQQTDNMAASNWHALACLLYTSDAADE